VRRERLASLRLGARAESVVCGLLRRRGFSIVGRNVRVGRAEIDIIAQRGRTLVFCEVRARKSAAQVHPLETIDGAKQRRIRRAALRWCLQHRARGAPMRFDAAAVTFEGCEPIVDYVENAF